MPPSDAVVDENWPASPEPARANGRTAARDLWIAEPAPGGTEEALEVWLDRADRRAYVGDQELPLTTQLFDLLAFFLDHRGEAVSFEDLAAGVWSYPRNLGDHHFLHTAVYRLRRILASAGVDDLVDGIRGFGYRIKADAASGRRVEDVMRAFAVFDPADPDLRLSMVNDAAVQLSGHSVATLTNLPAAAARLWTPEERAVIDAAVREALERGCAESRGRQLLRADGTVIVVDVTFSRLDLPGREPLCLAEVRPSI